MTMALTLPTKSKPCCCCFFPVVMHGCELTMKKTEHQRTDAFRLVLDTTLESPLSSKEIKPVNPKGNQPWLYIGRTDAEAETPIFWPPDRKNWLTGNVGKNWWQVEKWEKENEMVGWHHWLNIHESEQTLENSEGQGGLVHFSLWGCKCWEDSQWLKNSNGHLIIDKRGKNMQWKKRQPLQ